MGNSINTRGELTPQNQPVLGARVVYEIPRTADLNSLYILFTGTVTLGVAATSIITDGILNLITAVELLANGGRDSICSVPFSMLTQGNMFRRKRGSSPSSRRSVLPRPPIRFR